MNRIVRPLRKLEGKPVIAGDKSVSHRSLLFGALAHGTTEITGLSGGEDVRSTARCLESLGISIHRGDTVRVEGRGLRGFQAPASDLDCGNSGSTMRMFMGFLSGQNFSTRLIGDESLSRRPMKRVAEPLCRMGGSFEMRDGSFAPVTVKGGGILAPINFDLKVASAQVKSAVLLAGLYADGVTEITGRIASRDHTERLLPHFGVSLEVNAERIRLAGGQELRAAPVRVPGDPSSAAFWAAATCVLPGSLIEMDNILLNPTRTGFLELVRRMGGKITEFHTADMPEPVGNVVVTGGELRGSSVAPHEVPSLIDEIPLVAVLATYAKGTTEVRGAEELRIKETDRIDAVAENLRRMGAEVETFPDGFRIEGPQTLKGATVESFHDHRIAMAFSIAALGAEGETIIEGAEAVAVSYPTFFETLERLGHG